MATRTRNRTSRLAVLDSSVRRPASTSPTGRSRSPLLRRAVVVGLVLVSLALITVSFREADSGPLNSAQNVASTALRPFQVAVERVARPFRDAYGWTSDLFDAKSEAARLRKENELLRQQVNENASARQENVELKALLRYRQGPTFPVDYTGLAAQVVGRAPSAFQQEIVVAVGKDDGVVLNAPVVTADGLVGQVTRVFSHTARVTLITDEQSAVSALDLRTQATGVVRHRAAADSLYLDRVSKKDPVHKGDEIITAGWRAAGFASLYPKGIPVGIVTSVGQTSTDLYKQVQIDPYVDVSNVHAVLVLVAKEPRS